MEHRTSIIGKKVNVSKVAKESSSSSKFYVYYGDSPRDADDDYRFEFNSLSAAQSKARKLSTHYGYVEIVHDGESFATEGLESSDDTVQQRDISSYSLLAQADRLEDDSIIFYRQLAIEYPEWQSVLNDIIDEELKHKGQVAALIAELSSSDAHSIAKGQWEGAGQLDCDNTDCYDDDINSDNYIDIEETPTQYEDEDEDEEFTKDADKGCDIQEINNLFDEDSESEPVSYFNSKNIKE